MLPNLSNAALLGILWVTRVFTKGGLCNMPEIPIFNIKRWPPCLRRSGYAQAGERHNGVTKRASLPAAGRLTVANGRSPYFLSKEERGN